MMFLSVVSLVLLTLLIAMLLKRKRRLNEITAFKRGQEMLTSDNDPFTETKLGSDLKRHLIEGDIKEFNRLIKESKKRAEEEGADQPF